MSSPAIAPDSASYFVHTNPTFTVTSILAGLIMDATRYGHRQVRLYVGPIPDDITLDKGNELQTNTGTMRQRPVRVPPVPKLVGTLKDDGVALPDLPDEFQLPQEFICPITSAPMSFPVIAEDGHSYQLQAIQRWFTTKLSSPVTGLSLGSAALTPNHALRKLIRDSLGVDDEVACTRRVGRHAGGEKR